MKMKDAQELLVKLEERNDEMEIQVSKLELINSKLEQNLSEREEHGSYESTIASQYKNEILQVFTLFSTEYFIFRFFNFVLTNYFLGQQKDFFSGGMR